MLLLDDVHEKCTPPELQPTIKIETKPGSEQWLYIFKEPAKDLEAVGQMMKTLAEAGHADVGGSTGKTASIRLGRLPGSDPKGRGIAARVVWSDLRRLFPSDPDVLFGPKGFNLKLKPKPTLTTHTHGVTLLNPAADPLLQWLSLNGHTRGGGGQTDAMRDDLLEQHEADLEAARAKLAPYLVISDANAARIQAETIEGTATEGDAPGE